MLYLVQIPNGFVRLSGQFDTFGSRHNVFHQAFFNVKPPNYRKTRNTTTT